MQNRTSHIGLIFILGLLSMLMPLAIDMYLPSMPIIAQEFGVEWPCANDAERICTGFCHWANVLWANG